MTDTDDVRASITPSWLVQLNAHEVAVFVDTTASLVEIGDARPSIVAGVPEVPSLAMTDLRGSETIIDLADSLRYTPHGVAAVVAPRRYRPRSPSVRLE